MDSIVTALNFNPKLCRPEKSAWVEHLPFAATLISEVRPNLIVELGTHWGESYFAFCQAVLENGVSALCYAVDTWQGECHAGQYDESVFHAVTEYNKTNYSGFSYLLRAKFNDASTQFKDNSIDILHIDGLHTYEAVKNDYETWLPKVKDGGLILFHDICCRHDDFGVWKLWAEIQSRNKNTFSFLHGYGLGVLLKGCPMQGNGFIDQLFDEKKQKNWRGVYKRLGEINVAYSRILQIEKLLSDKEKEINHLKNEIHHQNVLTTENQIALNQKDTSIVALERKFCEQAKEIANIKKGLCWKIDLIRRGFIRFSRSLKF